MRRDLGKRLKRGLLPLFGAAALALVGCDGLLDVDRGAIVVPEDIDEAGPAAVPTIINGVVGDYHVAADDVARYAGLLTDEFILGGTFPTRVQVDHRRIIANNLTLTVEMYIPLQRARLAADTAVFLFEQRLTDPEFEEVVGRMQEGMVLGSFYGGYSRLWLAELYCWSILTGMAGETTPILPDARMQDAITKLQQTRDLVAQFGILPEYATAATVGLARAHLWLGNFEQAATLAGEVDTDFVLLSEYSSNDPDQYNDVYTFSWGDTQVIRWTVGDGTQAARGNEIFEHFDEFVDMGLILPNPAGLATFQGTIPVMLQLQYSAPQAPILLASGAEARLIEAEAAVRPGGAGSAAAEAIINDLRGSYAARANARFGLTVSDPPPVNLSGDMQEDLKAIADERARELWLTGDRHTTARRFRLDPDVQLDLFPPNKQPVVGGSAGDDIAFPIVQRELDNNPNLGAGDACPSGAPGSWQ